jgi:hypothetical protein
MEELRREFLKGKIQLMNPTGVPDQRAADRTENEASHHDWVEIKRLSPAGDPNSQRTRRAPDRTREA